VPPSFHFADGIIISRERASEVVLGPIPFSFFLVRAFSFGPAADFVSASKDFRCSCSLLIV
jgi:hypothetical protein